MVRNEDEYGDETIRLVEFEPTHAEKEAFQHFKYADKCWYSDDEQYWVTLNRVGKFRHVKVHRSDHATMNDFHIFQQVKNLVLGEDSVAVQVFPAQRDLVDGSNTYHLWAWEGIESETPNLHKMPRYH